MGSGMSIDLFAERGGARAAAWLKMDVFLYSACVHRSLEKVG